MIRMRVGSLTFDFPDGWLVTQYDDWAFYRKQFRDSCGGNKAVDLLIFDPADETLWLVEVKDYRLHRREKEIDPWDEIALKLRDTLAGLAAARFHAVNDDERTAAHRSLQARQLHAVFHLEQRAKPSRLNNRTFDLANVQQKLRQIVKPIDPHPRVVDMNHMGNLGWTVRSGSPS